MLRRSLLFHSNNNNNAGRCSGSINITAEELHRRFSKGLPHPVPLNAQFYVEGHGVKSLSDVKSAGCNQVILVSHGLLGSARNWNGTAKRMGWKLPKTTAIACLDLRNHGSSPHDSVHTMDSISSDLELFAKNVVSEVGEDQLCSLGLIGHSMGGAATVNALSIMRAKSELLPTLTKYVKSSVIVDICPDCRPMNAFRNIEGIFEAMKTIDFDEHKNYTAAEKKLKSTGLINNDGLRAFVMTNFSPVTSKEPFARWKCNFPILYDVTMSGRLFSEDCPVVHDQTKEKIDVPTFFVFGEDSSYNNPEARKRIPELFSEEKQVALKNAGHYVHVERQEEFAKEVADWFSETLCEDPRRDSSLG